MDSFQACPVCGGSIYTDLNSVKDYSITQELFLLKACTCCGFVFTDNAPSLNEIGRYYASDVYISHTDSKKGLIENLYQLVRKRTLAQKRKLVTHAIGGKQGAILDYGCGTGAFLHEMKSHGWQINGIEPDEGARKKAEQLTGTKIGVPDTLSVFPDASFDVITLWHVLEHVHDLNPVIENFKRLLRPNGKIIVAVPNHTSYDASYYGKYWAAYDVPRHLYHFTPESMGKLMGKYALNIMNKKGMWFDAFYVAMLSEKYKSGTINYVKAFFIGLLSNVKALINVDKCSSLIYIISK